MWDVLWSEGFRPMHDPRYPACGYGSAGVAVSMDGYYLILYWAFYLILTLVFALSARALIKYLYD